jgi:hypothetical protein
MMKKIWGLLIILSCCFVSVSFGQETSFNLAGPDHPNLIQTRVDVSIEKNGILTFLADNSLLQEKITMTVSEKITLLSGDYAGWGYAHIEYNAGKLKGRIYYVFHEDEGRGMLSGDVIGIVQQATGLHGDMIWRIAKLDGASTQVSINLLIDSYKPGKKTLYQDIWMPVLPSFKLSAVGDNSGEYIGPYDQVTTVLLLPAPDGSVHNVKKFKGGGLEFGSYQAGDQTGTVWSFLDNTEMADPFSQRRYGTRDGILAGTSEIVFLNGAGGNSEVIGTTLHVEQY